MTAPVVSPAPQNDGALIGNQAIDEPRTLTQHIGLSWTVVIPAFDAEQTIGRALESVVNQKFNLLEVIVIDDGSRDRTPEIVREYAARDLRIHLVRQRNAGPARARNVGVEMASSDFVTFLDADDEFLPGYFDVMTKFIHSHPNIDIYHPNLLVVRSVGDVTIFDRNFAPVSYSLGELLEECVIAIGGASIRRMLLSTLGGFREGVHCEDYDLMLRALAQGARPLFLPTPLYVYHQENQRRRSVDVVGGFEGYVESVRLLEARGLLPPILAERTTKLIRQRRVAIERELRRRQIAIRVQRMAEQEERLRRKLENRFGEERAASVLRRARAFAWVVRPMRKLIAGRTARRSWGDSDREELPHRAPST